ncbi:hypothetical protein SADUNF_Sadunf12G0035300 [Salix dunnii]|uniref:Uncharacterized protein n=1 Tax=Salix dunnii TaxID=1413687 RepID=A0A835JKD7_9ROSI|nr:hypothetical protein SADUNF_Sadunf12G0035300 [Salix dunnii]
MAEKMRVNGREDAREEAFGRDSSFLGSEKMRGEREKMRRRRVQRREREKMGAEKRKGGVFGR